MEDHLVPTSSASSVRGQRGSIQRARCLAPWAPELGTRMCCETPVSVGHVFARSMLGLRCPWTTLRLALKGSGGPDRRYGVLRARNAKTLLVDVFLYLTVVCWTSKKSLFSWRIPRAEFLIHFQDPSRAGKLCYEVFKGLVRMNI